MAYRKSYYEQRTDEQAAIREAIQKIVQENETGHGEGKPEPTPDSSWTKAQILDWLVGHGVAASSSLTKSKLLELVAAETGHGEG